jgi:putative ABC transport system permease protein
MTDLDLDDHDQPDLLRQGRSRLRWTDAIIEGASAIGQRPVRTLLTALGTILGVGAFITTAGLAQTAQAQVSARFDALAATEVRIRDTTPDGTNPFPDDVDDTLKVLNGINHAGLSFSIPDNGTIELRATATRPVNNTGQPIPLIAATPGAIQASLPTLLTGRTYDRWHEQRGEHVAVLGRVAANQLGITRVDNGPVVFIEDTAYTVVGILDDVDRNPDLLLATIIPTSAASGQLDTRNVEREITIDTQPGAAPLIGHQAPIALRPQQPERLQALVPPDPKTLRNQVEGDVQSLFYALSGLALLIGAVAITNATLLNIIERRPEIGLRRALGATRGHITRQVALEAALTGILAGIIGGTLGTIAVTTTALARGWTATIDPALILAAPALGIATGTLAGILPAFKASRTPPAETLRT